jgi:hypothetical protein
LSWADPGSPPRDDPVTRALSVAELIGGLQMLSMMGGFPDDRPGAHDHGARDHRSAKET